jgi:hypothetical protein
LELAFLVCWGGDGDRRGRGGFGNVRERTLCAIFCKIIKQIKETRKGNRILSPCALCDLHVCSKVHSEGTSILILGCVIYLAGHRKSAEGKKAMWEEEKNIIKHRYHE